MLPLLSHALDQAWRSKTGPVLTVADYERTGGIEGAVADSAQRAYDQLTPGQQAAAQQVFTRLTAASSDGMDTADRATRAELTEGKNPAEAGVAAEWARQGRDPSYLYRGNLLQAADDAAARAGADPVRNLALSRAERDFLQASNRARRRSTRLGQAAIAGLAALALVASVLSVLANQQRAAAIRQRDQANREPDRGRGRAA